MVCGVFTSAVANKKGLEAPSGFEPEMEVLQTSALPLGDGADQRAKQLLRRSWCPPPRFGVTAFTRWLAQPKLGGEAGERRLERETGFEPATSTLARSHSTTELFPLATNIDHTVGDLPQQHPLTRPRRGLIRGRGPAVPSPARAAPQQRRMQRG
jgi:hypothetical protein